MSNAVPQQYQTVAAGQSATKIGATGSAGDFIDTITCVVATAATSQVQLQEGSGGTPFTILPNAVGQGIGTYTIPIKLKSKAAAWYVVTAAGVSVIVAGNFT